MISLEYLKFPPMIEYNFVLHWLENIVIKCFTYIRKKGWLIVQYKIIAKWNVSYFAEDKVTNVAVKILWIRSNTHYTVFS